MRKVFLLGGCVLVMSTASKAQISIDNTLTPTQLVQNVLLGGGVTAFNITFNGLPGTTVHEQIAGFSNGATTPVGISDGVVLGTGDVMLAESPFGNDTESDALGGGNMDFTDTDLEVASSNPGNLNDAAILEFDFIPAGDSVKFKYVFASEEYPEYVMSVNDAFAFFLSGPGITGPYSGSAANIAIVPGTASTAVTINTVNKGNYYCPGPSTGCTNCAYYVDNCTSTVLQYDGLTTTLIAKAKVQCGQVYHIKIVIADASDEAWDSAVFLEAGSFSSEEVNVDLVTTSGTSQIYEGCAQGGTFSFLRPASSDTLTIPVTVAGNASNGVDYTPAIPSSITFLPGQDSVGITFTAVADGLPEGVDSLVITVVNINPCGDTVVSTVTLYIHDPIPLNINLGPDLVLGCTGGTLTLDPHAIGGYAPYTYNWSTGASTPTISYTVTGNDQIILTTTGDCGSTDTDTLNVTIVPPTNPIWLAPTFSSYCPNDTLTIAGEYISGGSAPFTYSWASGGTDSLLTVSPDDTTTFFLTITDFCGLDTTIGITVNVREPLPFNAEIADGTICKNPDNTFTLAPVITNSNGNVVYTWYESSPGSISTPGYDGSITITDGAPGGLFVLVAYDECHIISIDSANVVVEDCIPVVPNIVTPNGDGINDVFVIFNLERHPNSSLVILNRWGQVKYESSNYQNDYEPTDLTDGVYYYVLKLTDGTEPAEYTGHVHINKN